MTREGERILTLSVLMKQLGNFDISSFEGRLVLQKTIYLLQSFGLFLGYKFSWYIHGPYSPDLTRDAFTLQPIFASIPKVQIPDLKVEKILGDFKESIGDKKFDADWLEQVACTHFLKSLYPESTKNEIIKKVMNHESHFTEKECQQAWYYLVKNNLIKN